MTTLASSIQTPIRQTSIRQTPIRQTPVGRATLGRALAAHTLSVQPHPIQLPSAGHRPGAGTRTLDLRVLVCNPARLAGEAVVAALRNAPAVGTVSQVDSVSDVLRQADQCDLAYVADTVVGDVLELLEALEFRRSALQVVTLTSQLDPRLAAQLLEAGATGTVDATRPLSVLHTATATARSGGFVIDEQHAQAISTELRYLDHDRAESRRVLNALSPRECRVIEALADGTGVTEIARTMNLSPHTIRSCIRTLGPKLQATGQLQIAAAARALMTATRAPSQRHLRHRRDARDTGERMLRG